ncbi:MAG: hypothetical protein F4X92_00655 [Gammaproteobacteria bacterium]|nr:hypothetical protein [Gammaproteobacteria bacterium]
MATPWSMQNTGLLDFCVFLCGVVNPHRSVNEFIVRYNVREDKAITHMEIMVAGMIGHRIMYKGRASGVAAD